MLSKAEVASQLDMPGKELITNRITGTCPVLTHKLEGNAAHPPSLTPPSSPLSQTCMSPRKTSKHPGESISQSLTCNEKALSRHNINQANEYTVMRSVDVYITQTGRCVHHTDRSMCTSHRPADVYITQTGRCVQDTDRPMCT